MNIFFRMSFIICFYIFTRIKFRFFHLCINFILQTRTYNIKFYCNLKFSIPVVNLFLGWILFTVFRRTNLDSSTSVFTLSNKHGRTILNFTAFQVFRCSKNPHLGSEQLMTAIRPRWHAKYNWEKMWKVIIRGEPFF